MDVMSFVAENCRFENSSHFAIDSGNYVRNNTPVGPWSVERDENGLAVLTENIIDGGNPNSTKFILNHCDFINCAGASGVGVDGSFIYDCNFVSEIPQKLPVFISGWTCSVWNCSITANIPADYQEGIIKNSGYLRNVTFISTSEYGAPLLHWAVPAATSYAHPQSVTIENCISASANSNSLKELARNYCRGQVTEVLYNIDIR